MTEPTTDPTTRAVHHAAETFYEIPREVRPDMRVAARIYADPELWKQISSDRSVGQLMNVATLPGIVEAAYAMPDAHEGYGFPVGGVAAFRTSDGVISPGGVGYDINCGVRLLASSLEAQTVAPSVEAVVHELSRGIPAGAGRDSRFGMDDEELDRVFTEGCGFLRERGMATDHDVEHTESGGCLPGADPGAVSRRARDRGRSQLGTMGSGNHFVELEVVEEVFDQEAAAALGLEKGRVALLIHTGSRGFGHQVCTDYVKRMDRAMEKHGIELPDRQLACAPFDSEAGRAYFGAMVSAANYAWCNRQIITHVARDTFRSELGADAELRLVYDVAHNIAKVEEHHGPRRIATWDSPSSSPGAWGPAPSCLWARTPPWSAPSAAPVTAPVGR